MSEELKATIYKVLDETWNKGNLDALDELYAAKYVLHNSPFPNVEGLDALKQFITNTRNAYPDLYLTVEELLIGGEKDNEKITTRWSWQGTNTGQSTLFPFPPTGKKVTVIGCSVTHRMGGKGVEEWFYVDYLGLLQQLGVVPASS